ncbi:MAG: SDR family oxidoreductase [Streptosporangiaceae bacterium]
MPLQRFAKPDEIAQIIVFLLSLSAAYVNRVVVPVDGGWSLAQ